VVALADAALHQPDFRSGERTAQLLVQVAGRAGRGTLPGRVLVQCFTPDAPAIAAVTGHDYAAFARSELAERESVGYPPLRRLALIRAEGADEAQVRSALEETARSLRALSGIDLLGPAPAPMVRLRDRYRYQLLLKSAHHAPLVEAARRVAEMEPRLPSGVDVSTDVDPVDML